MIRAIFRSVQVPGAQAPYNTMMLKLFYPAAPTGSTQELNSGVIPADTALAPFPVVIMMPGINVGMEGYQWLAVKLAEAGLVVVTYNWVAEDMPGYISLTPGVNLAAVRPDSYGSQATSPAISPILAELARLHSGSSVLAGLLDLDNVILGGHSAGGTMALQNGNPDWFPQVTAVFSYAGHTMASTMLGFAPETILPLSGARPCLIIGGSADGVIAASSGRYGGSASPTQPVERTFHEALAGGRDDCYLVLLAGANHFTLVHPVDVCTGRPFLDQPATQPEDQLRGLLADLIILFIQAHTRLQPQAQTALSELNNHPLIDTFLRK